MLADGVQQDLRREHFSYGNDKVVYKTDAQDAQVQVLLGGGEYRDPKADKERAQALKKQLLTPNVVIGNDEKYM